MMRSTKRIAVLALVAAVALTGCAGRSASDVDTTARGPITMAMGSNDAGKLAPVIEAWNAAHPDETVTMFELPKDADPARDTLVQSLQARSGDYDVMALDVVWTGEFAAHRWILPLEGDLAIDTSGLLPATVDSATYRETLYAAPMNTNAQLLFYRTDLVPTAPATWQDLLANCPTARAADVDCLDLQLKSYEGITVQATQAINSWGGSAVGPDGLTPTVTTPQATAAIQALTDAYADGDIAGRSSGFTEEETNLAFLAGETMYAYNWPYMFDTAKTEPTSTVGDDFAVAPIVGPDGVGASTLGGYNNAINAYSEYPATARDFVAFVQNEDNQRAFADQSFPPVLASVYDDPELVAQYPYLPVLKDALEHAQPRPVTPFYSGVSKAIQDNAYAAITGARPVDQALADMQAAMTAAAS